MHRPAFCTTELPITLGLGGKSYFFSCGTASPFFIFGGRDGFSVSKLLRLGSNL